MALMQTANTDMEDSDFPELDLETILTNIAKSGAKVTDAHLRVVEKDIQIDNTKTTVHCYSLTLDGNGRVRYKPLAEFLRDRIVDYAIPRKQFEDAQREQNETNSAAPMVKLHEEAKRLFTKLENTGEGGELLLFAMAEAVFGYAQILCKMSLKTATSMHYHGSDGVFLQARIPEFAIEALHQGVLTRLPRLDKPEPDPRALRPEEEGLASELWPVIQHNGLWTAPLESQVIQKPADAFARNRKVHELADAFPAVIVHDVQNAHTPTRG